MNGRIILGILALIVIGHVLVIYLFVREGDKKEPQAPVAPAVQEQQQPGQPMPAQPGAVQAKPGQMRPGTPGQPPQGMGKPGGHENPNFGKPFIYDNAVKGNIGSIPSSSESTAGILVDLDTRQVLWAKNPKEAFPIASMTKMMTMLIAYEDVLSARNGLTMDTQIKVTPAATKIGGSQVYLDPKESFTLRDLLKMVSIKSANDAAYLVAEHLGGGDVYSFVKRMNARAKELGMTSTSFHNPHGLPEKPSTMNNVSSPEDLSILAEHILESPQLMEWAATWTTDFREKGQKGYMQITNHNHLVPGSPESCPGVDGMKTGFINMSGFCITVTCKRGGKRLVAVVTGVPTRKGRDLFMKKLLDWGYARAENPSPKDSAPASKSEPAKKKSGAAAAAPKKTTTAKQKKPQ